MFNAHVAAYRFAKLDDANWNHWRYNAPAPDETALGYRHGWIQLEGVSYNREACMNVGAPQPAWVLYA